MTYNLDNKFDRERFRTRCDYLMERRAVVDLTEHTFRSTSQNRYLHLLIGLVALEVGETVEYVKANHFKRMVNPDIFIVMKDDRFLAPFCLTHSLFLCTHLTQLLSFGFQFLVLF